MLCVSVKIQAGKQSPLSACEQRKSNTRNWLHRWRKGLKSKQQGTRRQLRDLQGPEDTTMMRLEGQKGQVVVPRSRPGVTQRRLELWWVEARAKKDIWSMWQKPPETRGVEKPYLFLLHAFQIHSSCPLLAMVNQSLLLLLLFSHPVVSNSLWPHKLHQPRPLCPSPSPRVCPSSYSLHQWCHPAISFSDAPFFCPQSFPSIRAFTNVSSVCITHQNTGASASASVLPMNIQGGSPLRLADLISLLSKGFSRVFSSTTIQWHQFFSILPSLQTLIVRVTLIVPSLCWEEALSLSPFCSIFSFFN